MIKKIFFKIIYLPFLMPFVYLVKFPIGNLGSLNLLDLSLLISIVLGLFLIFKEGDWANFKKQIFNNNFLKIIFLFLFFAIISNCFSLDKNWIRTLSLLKSFLILPIFFSIIIKYFFKKNSLKFHSFLKCYFIYSVFLSLFTVLSWLTQKTTFDNRVCLFFDSPNQLGIALSLGIISGSFLLIRKFSNFTLTLILFLGIALLMTKSIGAILAVLIVVFFLYNKKTFPAPNIIIKIFLTLSLFIILLFPILSKVLNNQQYDPFLNRNSLDSRLTIYSVSQKILPDNFVNGIGLANFQDEYLKRQSGFPPYPQWAVPHAHNLFLQVWLSFGLLSFILWIYLFYKKTLPAKDLLGGVALYFILYFLVHGLVDVPIWNNDQALFFWLIFLL